MTNEKLLKFSCIGCGTCCTDTATLVNVTYQDILRIKNGLDLNLEEILEIIAFYMFDKQMLNENQNKMVISPIKTEKGLAYIGLMKNSNGMCLFYNEKDKNCSIYNLRPAFCRTFPFSFRLLKSENKKKINIIYTEKGKQYCPGIGEEAPLIDYNYWNNLGKKILEDLKMNSIVIKEWNEKSKKSGIPPSVKNFLHVIFNINDK